MIRPLPQTPLATLGALALVLAGLGLALMAGPAQAARCVLPSDLAPQQAAMVKAVNNRRAAAGLAPLTPAPALDMAAQGHACDLAARRQFTHLGFDGTNPERRIARSGYDGCGAEMIARGEASAALVIPGWMGTEEDRAALGNPAATEIGVGLALSETAVPLPYWVVLTGGDCAATGN